jgi:hypothetical protein
MYLATVTAAVRWQLVMTLSIPSQEHATYLRLFREKIEIDCQLLVIDGIGLQNGLVTPCYSTTSWFIKLLHCFRR